MKATARSVAALIVLAAHLGLAHFLMRGDRSVARHAETSALNLVWIRATSPVRSVATATAAPQRPMRAAPAITRLAVEPVGNTIQVPALIAPTPANGSADHSSSAAAAARPEPPASAPLDLRLPGRLPAQRGLAEAARDAAHQPRPLDHGQRLTRDLGTDTRLVETVTDQGRRYVWGRSCIEVRPSRASQLDPFNASTQPVPKLAGPCLATASRAQ